MMIVDTKHDPYFPLKFHDIYGDFCMYLGRYLFTESPDVSYISHRLVSRKYFVLVFCRKSNAVKNIQMSKLNSHFG